MRHAAIALGLSRLLFLAVLSLPAQPAFAQCELEFGTGSCPDDPPGGGGLPQPCDYSFPNYDLAGLAESVRHADYSPGGVSLVSGQFVHSETDLGVFDTFGSLGFTRSYRSGIRYNGPLGPNWTHNWNEKLVIGSSNDPACGYYVRWARADGSTLDFYFDDQGDPIHPDESLQRIRKLANGRYQVRDVGGGVREFSATGALRRLEKIFTGGGVPHAIVLEYDGAGRLNLVKSQLGTATPVTRLDLDYNPQGRLSKVWSGVAAGQTVNYSYGSCGELIGVAPPAVASGYDRDGDVLVAEHVPGSTYTYATLPGGCSRVAFLLATIALKQLNPLSGATTPVAERVLENLWDTTALRVKGQCLGRASCPSVSAADYRYEYGSEAGTTYTYVHDQRLAGTAYYELHRYADNRLIELVEDEDPGDNRPGLHRVTTYAYDSFGLLNLTTFPDGSCEQVTHAKIGDVWLPVVSRQRVAAACNGGGGEPDRVTRIDYEAYSGQPRAVSPPESFPDGEIPASFDPAFDPYTTLYDYDFDQTPEIDQECQDWGLPCPAAGENVNDAIDDIQGIGSGTDIDDGHAFGHAIRERRYVAAAGGQSAGYLTTLRVYRGPGRILAEQRLFDPLSGAATAGNRMSYEYYVDAAPNGRVYGVIWDYRSGDPYSPAGDGPLATVTVENADGASAPPGQEEQQTLFGWSPALHLIAQRDAAGLQAETTYNRRGDPLERKVRCVPGVSPNCAAGADLLTLERYSHDLRGRTVREALLSGDETESRVGWTTYDSLGRPTSTTVDPDPTLVPGAPAPTPAPGPDDPQHLVTRLHRDGRGRAVKTVAPAGRVTCQAFDSLDRVIELRLSAGWDNGTSACSASPGDQVVTTDYDAMDRPVVLTDGNGVAVYRWYDGHGRLRFEGDGDPDGSRSDDVVFLNSQQPTSWPPPAAQRYSEVEETQVDTAGRWVRTRVWGSDGRSAARGWLAVGWQKVSPLGQALAVHTAISVDQAYVPPAHGSAATPPVGPLTDLELASTTLGYDALGRPVATTDPAGRISNVEYDGFGRPKKALGRLFATAAGNARDTSVTAYDTQGRPWRTTVTEHDPNGAPHVRVTETAFDGFGRTVRVTSAPGDVDAITTLRYDVLGRLEEQVVRWENLPTYTTWHAKDRVTLLGYDRVGRRTSGRVRERASPDVFAITSVGYDRDGRTVAYQDAQSNITDYTLDASGRLTKLRYPTEGGARQTVETDQWDGNGNALRVHHRAADDVEAARVTWLLTYDERNRLTVRDSAIDFGALGEPPDFRGTTRQEYAFDDLGRIVKARDFSPAAQFPGAAELRVERAYDSGGRLLAEDQQWPLSGALASHTVESAFDVTGFRTALIHPAQTVGGQTLERYRLSFVPDGAGRLAEIAAPNSPLDPPSGGTSRTLVPLAQFEWVGSRPWLSRYPTNGTRNRVTGYDGLGRTTGLRSEETAAPANLLLDYGLGFDRVGNLAWEQHRHEPLPAAGPTIDRGRAYTADGLGRLLDWREGSLDDGAPIPPTAADPAGTIVNASDREVWQLDLVGNWQTRTAGPAGAEISDTFDGNPLNQYASVTVDDGGPAPATSSFGHDWLGQLREDERRNQAYVWDAFGRLTEVRNLATGALEARYRYDAFNRRVEKAVYNEPVAVDPRTRFIYDGWRAIEERAVLVEGGGEREVVRARYGFGVALDAVLWMDRDVARGAGGVPDPITGMTNETMEARYFLHHDLRGSVVAVTNDPSTAGGALAVEERFSYSAYGELSAWWTPSWQGSGYAGAPSGRSEIGLPYLYTGQRFDPESGLNYYKYRFVDPSVGRFLRRDLLGYADGPLLYGYAGTNPTSTIDPLGLSADGDLWGVVTASWRNPYKGQTSADFHARGPRQEANCGTVGVAFRNCGEKQAYWQRRIEDKALTDPDADWTEDELREIEQTFRTEFGLRVLLRELTAKEYAEHYGISTDGLEGYHYGPYENYERVTASGGARLYRVLGVEISDDRLRRWSKELLQLAYDWEDPLFGSHIAEALSIVIAPVKWTKTARAARNLGAAAARGAAAGLRQVTIKSAHGARHLEGTGLASEAVESAITKHVQDATKGVSETGSFWGRVTVEGQAIEYRAFTLPDGTINVGTYYPPVP